VCVFVTAKIGNREKKPTVDPWSRLIPVPVHNRRVKDYFQN
jgi:hypothetical protein